MVLQPANTRDKCLYVPKAHVYIWNDKNPSIGKAVAKSDNQASQANLVNLCYNYV